MAKLTNILLILLIGLSPVIIFAQAGDKKIELDMEAYLEEIRHVRSSLKYIQKNENNPKSSRLLKAIDRRESIILRSGPILVSLYNKYPKEAVFELIVEAQKHTKFHLYKGINGNKFIEYSAQELDRLQKQDLMRGQEILQLTDQRSKYVIYFKRFITEFKQAFPAFTAAQGVIAVGDLKHNPVAIEQFLEQFKDPLLMSSSFGVFIGASHLVQAGLGNKMSPGLKANVGLGAGMFASAVYTEIWNDIKNGVIGQCSKDFELSKDISIEHKNALDYLDKAYQENLASITKDDIDAINNLNEKYGEIIKAVKQQQQDQINVLKKRALEAKSKACDLAWQKWGTHDKYVNYTPDVTSLLAASYLNHKTIGLGVKIMDKTKFIKDIMPKLRLAGTSNPFVGFVYMTGNFVIFMKIHHKIMPYFLRPWNHINFNYLGFSLSQDLKNAKTKEHSRYLRTYKANKSQVKWLEENIDNINGFLKPENLKQCLANAKKFSLKRALTTLGGVLGEALRPFYRAEHCQQYYNPALIIENDYAFNKEKKRLRLESFKTKQSHWHQMLGNYSRRVSDAKIIYNELLRMKKEFVPTAEQKYPEQLNMSFFQNNFEDAKGTYPDRKGNLNFNHMSEYYIYQMACGPSLDTRQGFGAKTYNPFENISDIEFLETPFGSSLEFVPPKVTTTTRHICDSKVFNKTQKMLRYNNKIEHLEGEHNDVFNAYWNDTKKSYDKSQGKDSGQAEYNNLAEYVFDNLDPKFSQEIITSDEIPENHLDYSWSSTVVDTLNAVWKTYEEAYLHLVEDELIPLFINTSSGGSITSISHQLSTSYKSFLRAFDLKPIIPETEKRLFNKIDLLEKTLKALNRSKPIVDKHITELRSLLKSEFKKHRSYIRNWKNNENLSKDNSTLSNEMIRIIRGINEALPVIDHDGYYYSDYALNEATKENCDSAFLSEYQNNFYRKQYSGLKVIRCQDKKMAQKLLLNVSRIDREDSLVNEQLRIITVEISEHYKMMNDLLNTIGNFK